MAATAAGLGRSEVRSLVRSLRRLGAFAGATDAELARVVQAGRLVQVPAGWSPIAENTPADKAYLLLEGEADVRHGATSVVTLHPGAFIGEVAIVTRTLRTASVVALTDLVALHFSRAELETLYAEVPAVRRALDESVRRIQGDVEPESPEAAGGVAAAPVATPRPPSD